jgi:photosystem II stability/assembly factor-like uncharacterized protein
MNARSLVAIAIVAVLTSVAVGQTTFRNVFRYPTGNDLRRIGFANTTTMYAIGDAATFVATRDSGTTFTVTTVSNDFEDLRVVDFPSAQSGVVGGEHGLVAFTNDGGGTWTVHKLPEDTVVTAVGFDHVSGAAYAGTLNGHVYSSANGGTSWQLRKTLKSPADTTDKIYSVLVGAHPAAATFLFMDKSGTVWRSTNGGVAWDSLIHTAFNASTDICFVDAQHGWVVERGAIQGTTDGGRTWPLVQFLSLLAEAPSVHFISATTGWVLQMQASGGGWMSTVVGTTNGGSSFSTSVNSGVVAAPIVGVRFDAAGTVGWLVGLGGEVRRTTNGGSQWFTVSKGNGGTTYSLSFANDNCGLVATTSGAGGYNYHSYDGGATWASGPRVDENAYNAVHMTAPAAGVLLQTSTKGLYTTDTGRTFRQCTPMPQQSGGFGHHIFPLNATTLFACGEGGLVAKSVNGGTGWTSISISGESSGMRGVYFRSATAGAVCGENGTIYATGNGGSSWSQISVAFQGNFNDIAFSSATDGWAVTDSEGVAFHTTNGGISWLPKQIGASDSLTRILFVSSTMGFIGGSHGHLYVTVDGGGTWRKIETGSSVSISDMCATPRTSPTTLWLCGGYGTVLKGSISVMGVEPPTTAVPSIELLDAPFPNPIASGGEATGLRFVLPTSQSVQLAIVSALGQTVRIVHTGLLASGTHEYQWNGRMADGREVPAGTYFAVLRAGVTCATRPIVVVR